MPISFQCGACATKLLARDGDEGCDVDCPKCGAALTVPDPLEGLERLVAAHERKEKAKAVVVATARGFREVIRIIAIVIAIGIAGLAVIGLSYVCSQNVSAWRTVVLIVLVIQCLLIARLKLGR